MQEINEELSTRQLRKVKSKKRVRGLLVFLNIFLFAYLLFYIVIFVIKILGI